MSLLTWWRKQIMPPVEQHAAPADSVEEHPCVRTIRLLDEHAEEALRLLRDAGYQPQDRSNRSGFDRSGWLYYVWRYDFKKQIQELPEVVEQNAVLEYNEIDAGNPTGDEPVRAAWSIQVYSRGQNPRLGTSGQEDFTLPQIFSSDLVELVCGLFQKASRAMDEMVGSGSLHLEAGTASCWDPDQSARPVD